MLRHASLHAGVAGGTVHADPGRTRSPGLVQVRVLHVRPDLVYRRRRIRMIGDPTFQTGALDGCLSVRRSHLGESFSHARQITRARELKRAVEFPVIVQDVVERQKGHYHRIQRHVPFHRPVAEILLVGSCAAHAKIEHAGRAVPFEFLQPGLGLFRYGLPLAHLQPFRVGVAEHTHFPAIAFETFGVMGAEPAVVVVHTLEWDARPSSRPCIRLRSTASRSRRDGTGRGEVRSGPRTAAG